ncbi:MAG: hypothetical protein JO022_14050, partial [Acidobacteriaceae bacterium]|nr:hypothetical protein [Acidobacteriaceae bacterium]
TTPLNLAAGQSVNFQIAFQPSASGTAQGTLSIDGRSFTLTGLGLDPPLPKATLLLQSTSLPSAQQSTISVQLASATQVAGTGTLTMDFHPAVASVSNDSAVQFLSGPPRAATVTFTPGDAAGKFNGASQLAFQTGTTAGTIVFTLQLPSGSQQASITVAPAVASFDTASGTAEPGALIVSLLGFDNTHSASQISFTFYGTNGQPMQAPLQLDLTNNFQTYFTSVSGGAFSLRANFPVSGDVTKVAGVDVALTNSAGVAKTSRISF